MTDDDRRNHERLIAIRRSNCALIEMANLDENRVFGLIMGRAMGPGRETHGELELATDARDFRAEAAEETCDRQFYLACAELLDHARKVEAIEAADDQAVHDERFEDLLEPREG